MKTIFLILMTLCYIQGTAQPVGSLAKTQDIEAIGSQDSTMAYAKLYQNTQGSPYLFDDWIQGKITLPNVSTYEEVPLRYDVYQDALLAESEKRGIIVVDKTQITGFSLGTPGIKSFSTFRKASELKDFQATSPDHFVQIFYDGPSALYAIAKKERTKKDGRPDTFAETTHDYYLKSPEGEFIKLTGKSALLDVFTDEKQKVEEFIKANNIVLDDGIGLVKVAMFYDQLDS